MKEISAGGIVYRKRGGKTELMLIEDLFNKITFAKGRIEKGETLAQTALREIEEETGIIGRIHKLLGTVSYRYYDPNRGYIDKDVTYYLIETIGGSTKPQLKEIRSVQWWPLEQANSIYQRRGYATNRKLLRAALDVLSDQQGGITC